MIYEGQPDNVEISEAPEIKTAKELAEITIAKLLAEKSPNQRWAYRHLESMKNQHESLGPFVAWLYKQLDDGSDHPLTLIMLRLALVSVADYAEQYGAENK